ncbi:hypothetical protein STSO111631_17345 [Stackebrandtia soli]
MTYPGSPQSFPGQPIPVGVKPGKSRASMNIIRVAIAVSLAAIVGMVLVFVLKPTSSTPTEVLEVYLAAQKSADLKAQYDYLCAENQEKRRAEWGGTEPPQAEIDELKSRIRYEYTIDPESERIDGDHATVDAVVTLEDEQGADTADITYPLVWENEAWKLCGKADVRVRDK